MSDENPGPVEITEAAKDALRRLEDQFWRVSALCDQHYTGRCKAEAEVTRLRHHTAYSDRGESETYARFNRVREILEQHDVEIDTKGLGTGDVERAVERTVEQWDKYVARLAAIWCLLLDSGIVTRDEAKYDDDIERGLKRLIRRRDAFADTITEAHRVLDGQTDVPVEDYTLPERVGKLAAMLSDAQRGADDEPPWDAVILHWAKRAAGDVEEMRKNDVNSCAFCQKYRPTDGCRDKCPIANRTEADECINFGAYGRWRDYFRVDQKYISCSDRTATPESCRLAADVVLAICEMRARWDAGERGTKNV